MKKLTVLVVVILIAGLLAGCWLFPESKLDYIEAETDEVTLHTRLRTRQLEITAYYTDGTSADVTIDCDYLSSDIKVVTVNDEGLITAVKYEGVVTPGLTREATILISYTQHNAWTGRIIRTCEVKVTVIGI